MSNAINRFIELIDTPNFHIPFSTQWAALITLPSGLVDEIQNISFFEDNRWYKGNGIFNELTKRATFTDDGVACIFVDSITQVGDGFGAEDANIGDSGTTGGIIPGIYSKNRTGFAQKSIKMKFRETSLSFTDFVIRPWIILASHYGRIADKSNVTKSPEITLINFSKGEAPIGSEPKVRKSIRYFECTPYQVDDIEMSYEKDTVMSYNVSWVFERYAIDAPLTAATDVNSFISRAGLQAPPPPSTPPLTPEEYWRRSSEFRSSIKTIVDEKAIPEIPSIAPPRRFSSDDLTAPRE